MMTLAKKQSLMQHIPRREARAEVESASPCLVTQQTWASILGSFLFHVVLLLILAACFYGYHKDVQLIDAIAAEIEPPTEPERLTLTDFTLSDAPKAADSVDTSQALQEARRMANASEPPPVSLAFLSPRGYVSSNPPSDGNGRGGNALEGLGEEVGFFQLPGNGSGEEQDDGEDGEVGFFGTKDKGKSFVFIVDCSGSMTTPTLGYYPRFQGPLTRFDKARMELSLSLKQLKENQTFYIIFYNHETYPLLFPQFAKNMLEANEDNLGLAQNWVDSVVPGGGTDPRKAFQIALALRPDVIFFLTDGIIPPVTRMVAKKNNISRTRVHTIAFGLPDHHDLLKGIASDHLGRFRFVP